MKSDVGLNPGKIDRIIRDNFGSIFLGDKYCKRIEKSDEIIKLDILIDSYFESFIKANYLSFKKWLWNQLESQDREV